MRWLGCCRPRGRQAGPRSACRSLFAPPSDDDYDGIQYFTGLQNLPQVFRGSAAMTRDALGQRFGAFAVRFTGRDRRTGGYEPYAFTRRVVLAARLNRWVANSLHPGTNLPGVLATVQGSLIVHYAVAAGEEQVRLGRFRDYPNFAGARAVARLLAVSAEEDDLLNAVQPLGKRAVNSLLATYSDSVEDGLALNWLTREGMYSVVTPERAKEAIETLNIVPRMVTRPDVRIAGYLDRPDRGKGEVRFEPVQCSHMILQYPARLDERIRAAWGRYVIGTMSVREPENPSLPRAPRRVRTLRRIDRVFETEEELQDTLD